MVNKRPYIELGEKIKEQREYLRKSIKEVSAEIDKDRTLISKIENGQIRPTLEVLDKLIKLYSFGLPEVLELYRLAGYSNQRTTVVGEEVNNKILNNDVNKTTLDQPPAEVLIPENLNILYSDSIFFHSGEYGDVIEIAQKIGNTNKHKVVARIGISRNHLKALRDLLNRNIRD